MARPTTVRLNNGQAYTGQANDLENRKTGDSNNGQAYTNQVNDIEHRKTVTTLLHAPREEVWRLQTVMNYIILDPEELPTYLLT